jgi:hypothetical protein
MRVMPFVLTLALCGTVGSAQDRDAATVIAEMRQALGGAATLDAVQTLSASGTVKTTFGGFTKSLSIDRFKINPRLDEKKFDVGR